MQKNVITTEESPGKVLKGEKRRRFVTVIIIKS